VEELAEHQQLLRTADTIPRIGVVDRAADEIVARLRAADDLIDPVGRCVRIAVDERQDLAACRADADRPGSCRERTLGELDGARRGHRVGSDGAGVVLTRVHDDHLEG
jgi:hypothetical protein